MVSTETAGDAVVSTSTTAGCRFVLDVHVELVEVLVLAFGGAARVEIRSAIYWVSDKQWPI